MGGNLRKCPFCGGKARYVYSMPLNYVECTKCKALGATIVDAYEQRDGKKRSGRGMEPPRRMIRRIR